MSHLSLGRIPARSASPLQPAIDRIPPPSEETGNGAILARILTGVYPNWGGDLRSGGPLLSTLGTTHWRTLQSLSRETDPTLFREDLFNWAHELRESGHLSLCLSIYVYLSEGEGRNAAEAGRYGDAILGRGSLSRRLEFQTESWGEKIFDPAVLAGMMAGSSLYRGVRFLSLSRMLGSSAVCRVLSPWGRRLASSSLGFTAEVPAFLLVEKGVRQVTQGPQDWSWKTLHVEGVRLGIGLFFLKTFSATTLSFFNRTQGIHPLLGSAAPLQGFSAWSQKILPLAAGTAGVWMGNRAVASLTGEALPDEATQWLDSAIFTLQFSLSGMVSGHILGPRLQGGLQNLDRLSFEMTTSGARRGDRSSNLPPPGLEYFFPKLVPASVGSFAMANFFPGEAEGQINFHQAFSRGEIRDGIGEQPVGSGKLHFVRNELAQKLDLEPEDPRLQAIVDELARTPTSQINQYTRLLWKSPHRSITFTARDGTLKTFTHVERLQRAMWMIRRVCQLDPFHRLHGTLLDALTQIAFEEVVQQGDPNVFANFLDVVAGEVTVERMEKFYEESDLHRRYGWMPKKHRYHLPSGHPWIAEIREMIFNRRHEELLEEIFAMYYSGGRVPYRIRQENYLRLRDGSQVPMTPELAFKGLKTFHDYWEKDPEGPNSLIFIENILDRAEKSKASWIYIDRIFKALVLEDHGGWLLLQSKLGEMAWHHEFNLKNVLGYIEKSRQEKGNLHEAAETITGSVHTGYLYSKKLASRLIRLYERIPDLTDPVKAPRRRKDFEKMAEDVLRRSGGKIGREEVLSLLAFNPSPIAQAALRDIRLGNLGFEVVDVKKMVQYSGRAEDKVPQAMLVYPEQRGEGEPSTHMIAVVDTLVEFRDWEDRISKVIAYPQTVVHEYAHFILRHHSSRPQGYSNRWDAMEEEFLAFTEEQEYRLHQGFTDEWGEAEISSYGWPGYLRGVIEQNYFQDPLELFVKP